MRDSRMVGVVATLFMLASPMAVAQQDQSVDKPPVYKPSMLACSDLSVNVAASKQDQSETKQPSKPLVTRLA